MSITLVTALYDINRETNGDGRTFDEYLSWFSQTLKIPSPMVIFVSKSLVSFVEKYRNNLPTKIVEQEIDEVPYYFLNEKIKAILESVDFKNKIGAPNRVECKNPLYNVIIFSKFQWVKKVIKENYFNTDLFMWMDAGLSRFFDSDDLNNHYPSKNGLYSMNENKDKVIIQTSMSYYPDLVNADVCTEEYFWDARTWVMAGLWGGGGQVLTKFCNLIDDVLQKKMISNNVINNEQNAMAYVYKNHLDLFLAFENYANLHRDYEFIQELAK
jgi:hypothetical protein